MAIVFLTRLMLLSVLLPSSLGRSQVSWKFAIPASNASGSCDAYDLTKVASSGPRTFSNGSLSYVFSLCENVPSNGVPEVCKNASASVAYQYSDRSCYSIGNLESAYVVMPIISLKMHVNFSYQ